MLRFCRTDFPQASAVAGADSASAVVAASCLAVLRCDIFKNILVKTLQNRIRTRGYAL